MATVPTVAAVAALDPEVAANRVQATMLVCMRPPRHPGQPLGEGGVHPFRDPRAEKDLTEHDVKGDRDQDEVGVRIPRHHADAAHQRQERIDVVQSQADDAEHRDRPESSEP